MATTGYRPDVTPATPSRNLPEGTLQSALLRLALRRNRTHTARGIMHALAWGVSLSAVLMLAHRLYLADVSPWTFALVLVTSVAFGWRHGKLEQGGVFEAARDADHALGLTDRLSSAIAFVDPTSVRSRRKVAAGSSLPARAAALLRPRFIYRTSTGTHTTQLVPALVADATEHAAQLQPKSLYPVRLDRHAKILAVAAIALAAFTLMPNLNWLRSTEQRALAAVLETNGKKLEAVAKEVRKRKNIESTSETKKLAARLQALGLKMQRGRMTKREALVSLGQLKKDLEQSTPQRSESSGMQNQDDLNEMMGQESMQSEEGKRMQEEIKKKDMSKAAEQLEKLAAKLDKGDLSKDEKEKVAKDLEKIARDLRKAGGKENEKAAQKLEQAARELQQKSQSGQKQGKNGKSQGTQGDGGQGSDKAAGGSSPAAGSLRGLARNLRTGTGGNSQANSDMLDKIRQAESDTGQNSGKASDGEMGGECKGPNCIESDANRYGVKDPHGNVNGGPGLGPRNNATGVDKGGGVSKFKSRGNKDKRRWEDVWSDRLPKTQDKLSRINGKMGSEGEMEQLPTRTDAKGGPVNTPYYDVYESYNKDAEDAVAKDEVPPAYKQPVKDYFDSIKPAN